MTVDLLKFNQEYSSVEDLDYVFRWVAQSSESVSTVSTPSPKRGFFHRFTRRSSKPSSSSISRRSFDIDATLFKTVIKDKQVTVELSRSTSQFCNFNPFKFEVRYTPPTSFTYSPETTKVAELAKLNFWRRISPWCSHLCYGSCEGPTQKVRLIIDFRAKEILCNNAMLQRATQDKNFEAFKKFKWSFASLEGDSPAIHVVAQLLKGLMEPENSVKNEERESKRPHDDRPS